ncbi:MULTISPECIES: hypothetical protein [Pseudomonas]|uniref:hypothetical protein n=1 Tax=Pseudomonas TaxID=286 RepID=UPI00095387D7|nr:MULTISPECIES: hypothetical protein [Pseudomonas]MCE0464866.1 hypothetical protein [Pseudomonas uvaldensis]ROO33413.1 hypothetical protein BIV09_23815 [Pseudomonas sp. 7SR1]SIS23187.1 hypothetical protein SAMN05428955_3424 [Pseudomonas sp. 7SR1]
MCNCATEVEAAAKEKIRAKLPEGSRDFSVELQGFAWLLGGTVSMKNKLNLHIEYEVPKKKGDGFQRKKQDMSMLGSYCMFCGEKYDKDEPKADAA